MKQFCSLPVNEDVYNVVNAEIKNGMGGGTPQPIMIIGREGSGKTALLRRLYESCVSETRIWIDGRSIFCTSDIMETAGLGAGSILFIDDFDYYLTRCSYDEQYRLRRFLYNEGAPMLISTVSKVLPAISEYEAPFFEGLKIVYISPIDKEELSCVFGAGTFDRALRLMQLMPPTIKSMGIVYDILRTNNVPDKDQERLLALFSDKYRNIYLGLPTYSQHILYVFGNATDELTFAELKSKSGLQPGILTAYLKRLRDVGIVSADKTVSKNTKYSVKDRLFKIWLKKTEPA